jgi:hypothetical protein
MIGLKALGCSDPHGVHDYFELVRYGEVRVVPSFSWISTFGSELLANIIIFAAAIALASAVYALLRAIGWVVGGFAA